MLNLKLYYDANIDIMYENWKKPLIKEKYNNDIKLYIKSLFSHIERSIDAGYLSRDEKVLRLFRNTLKVCFHEGCSNFVCSHCHKVCYDCKASI